MEASFELFEHTADIGIRAFAPTPAGLLQAAGDGLYAVIGELVTAGDPEEVEITASADSPAVLLRDYLHELLILFERGGRQVTAVNDVVFGARKLTTKVRAERLDPARSAYHREVKAITYHELDLRQTETGYEATLIVDI
jgi:SHS2 domain-containing protein